MNQDTLKGQWKQLQGAVKKQWGKLTDDDLAALEGQREEVIGKIQQRYGIAREEAARQWKEFEAAHRSTYQDEQARLGK